MLVAAAPVMAQENSALPDHVIEQFGQPPAVPEGALSEDLEFAVREVFINPLATPVWGRDQDISLNVIAQSNDPRLAWIIADMMRFTWQRQVDDKLADAAANLLGIEFTTHLRRSEITNHLIAWNIPSYPGYLETKRAIFTNFVPGWDRIFVEGDLDWRMVTWGGVLIDDRPFEDPVGTCSCIPAADNPEVTSAAEATWLRDEDIVFGIVLNGEARAYPRRIMEVREMVNDTLGGRDLGIPYCTLCGAAQAYLTDALPEGLERPILRTSGLLIRSNKVMYDLNTYSIFDTFRGTAVTGPLADLGVQLEQVTVVTSDWGSWKAAHPQTTVLVEELALGQNFDFRNGRDAFGPIFPVGDVDPRLPVHEDIIGVFTPSGDAIAFRRSTAFLGLSQGVEIQTQGVRLELDGGGIRAFDANGDSLVSHEAFWFAWSQFYPETALWTH